MNDLLVFVSTNAYGANELLPGSTLKYVDANGNRINELPAVVTNFTGPNAGAGLIAFHPSKRLQASHVGFMKVTVMTGATLAATVGGGGFLSFVMKADNNLPEVVIMPEPDAPRKNSLPLLALLALFVYLSKRKRRGA